MTSPESEHSASGDIWDDNLNSGSRSDHRVHDFLGESGEMLSDLPAVQRQHMTAGYREGLSSAKAKSMQGGFDQGYPIGFELGSRVGYVLGVLEGFLKALPEGETGSTRDKMRKYYGRAKSELKIGALLEGLDEECLGREDFGVQDLPERARAELERWEAVARELLGTRP